MQTVLDSINAKSAADQGVATAQADQQAAQATLANADAAVTTAQATAAAADQRLADDLHAGAPVFILNQDGTATGYAYDAQSPVGFTVVAFQPAGAVPSSATS